VMDAARLIALIPCHPGPWWWPSIGVIASRTGGAVEGAAAGGGHVSMEGNKQTVELTLGGDVLWRAGGYKVTHRRGVLTITRMLDIDPIDGHECYLRYRVPCRPDRLEVSECRQISVGPLSVSFSWRRTWKRPRD